MLHKQYIKIGNQEKEKIKSHKKEKEKKEEK